MGSVLVYPVCSQAILKNKFIQMLFWQTIIHPILCEINGIDVGRLLDAQSLIFNANDQKDKFDLIGQNNNVVECIVLN